jgi:CheY-like chemotaxis protein
VEVDATQIRQVIMNLITNAAEAVGQRSGVVTISTGITEVDQNYLAGTYIDDDLNPGYYSYLEVSDTGQGMDAKTRARIFDPFFTTKFTGRGLGLSAVLGIVRGHRGAIKVYSEAGRGTSFKVLLPCQDEPAKAEEKPAEESKSAAMEVGGLVLVVDDEESVRSVTKMMLERRGFTVLTAEDGRAGVDAFRAHAQDIRAVILDMTMPHMNGEQAFGEIRRINPEMPVILASGYNEQDATSRFAGKGLAGFIQKPFRMKDLLEKLRQALERSVPLLP